MSFTKTLMIDFELETSCFTKHPVEGWSVIHEDYIEFDPDGVFIEMPVTIEVNYTPGEKGCRYMPNGDPGYPDEPAEIEIVNIEFPKDQLKEFEFINGQVDMAEVEYLIYETVEEKYASE